MKPNYSNEPGFIVGVARSGTTLVSAILNRHDNIYVTPETHFFSVLSLNKELSEKLTSDWPSSYSTYLEYISNIRKDRAQDYFPSAQEVWNKESQPTIKEIFDGIGNALSNKANKQFWIEKTPGHLNYLDDIRENYPNSPIIQIIRDGRDVAVSLGHVYWGNNDYFINFFKWINESEKCSNWINEHDNCFTIKYEDILINPNKEIKKLCHFLKVNYTDDLLIPNKRDNNLIEKGSSHKNLISKPIKKTNKRKWVNTLNEKQKKISLIFGYKQLRRYGYIENIKNNSVSINIDLSEKINKTYIHEILIKLDNEHSIYFNDFYNIYESNSYFHIIEKNPLIHDKKILKNLIKSLIKLTTNLIIKKNKKIIWIYKYQPTTWKFKIISDFLFGIYSHKIFVTCTDKKDQDMLYKYFNKNKVIFFSNDD